MLYALVDAAQKHDEVGNALTAVRARHVEIASDLLSDASVYADALDNDLRDIANVLHTVRLTRGACVACGRRTISSRWTIPAAAARWGRWGVAFAVVAPLAYATTRLAWVVGIPLGISESLLRQVRGEMMGAAAGLASVAICGAILTIGLVRPWGEVFPRWIPHLRGRRVPPALAIVPASFVAVLVFAAGLGIVRDVVREGLPAVDWLAHAPGLLWPFWGLGLGAATLAYHYRRRGRCWRCGRW